MGEEDTYENPNEQPAARGGYVEDDTYENPNEAASRGGGGGITAIALYDYQAQADDEISFDPNDIISNIEMVDNDWWAGVLRGVRGCSRLTLYSSLTPPFRHQRWTPPHQSRTSLTQCERRKRLTISWEIKTA